MTKNLKLRNKQLDVVGIGNAIVDILVQTKDSFLKENCLNKGSMLLVDETKAENLYSRVELGLESSGGSAANTLAGIAQLGGNAAFIGRVRNDQLGKIFTHDIKASGAQYHTPPATSGAPTARCLIFVSPDAQRTMCTYLGASVLLEPKDLDLSIIAKAKVLYLEGYLWDNPTAKQAFITAAKLAKETGGQVSLSLSDSFCVERHRKSFLELIHGYVDILFANESEIISLYECNTIEEASQKVKNSCEIAALTCGEKGSIIIERGESKLISPYKLGNLIDTTGAGDLYAAGFLYGYTKGKDLYTCGKIGSLCAGQIVTQLGSRCQLSLIDLVRKHIN